jgi:hypothetical protein
MTPTRVLQFWWPLLIPPVLPSFYFENATRLWFYERSYQRYPFRESDVRG